MARNKASASERRAKKAQARGSAGPRRAPAVVVVGALVLALALWWSSFREVAIEPATIPAPDTSGMEPQVADRIEQARGAVTREPGSANAWGRLGMVLHAHELREDASLCYEEALRLESSVNGESGENGSARWRYLLARTLEHVDPERALAIAREVVEAMPDFLPAQVLVGELEEQSGRGEPALAAYRAAQALDDTAAVAELGIGRVLVREGELQEGLRHLERAAELDPEAGAVQAALAQSYRRAGRIEDARRASERASRLAPTVAVEDPLLQLVSEQAVSVVGLSDRARQAEARGEVAAAESLIRRTIELRPNEPDLVYNLANLLSRNDRTEEAIAAYRRVISMDGEHLPALVNLGIALQEKGELEEASRSFRRANEIDPEHSGALAGLGHVAAREGRFEEAESFFVRSLAADPARPDVSYALAQIYLFLGRPTDAIPHFRIAIEGAPDRVAFRLDLADAYARAGAIEQARAELREAEALGVAVPSALYERLAARNRNPR